MKRAAVLFALALITLAAAPPPDAIQVHAKDIVWKDGPPALKGSKSAVLEGDPKAAGLYTMRLRIPAGSKLPPHWHPRAERAVVLSGQVEIGFGDVWDDKAMHVFGPGDFYVTPPNSHHFVRFSKETVVQLTGEGPWEVHPLQ